MCGRYVSASSTQEIADYFRATSVAEALVEPNYNVAPTAQVPVIRSTRPTSDQPASERHLDMVRWGLVPSWAKSLSIGAKLINARSETVATKNSFRAAAKRRRCLIPADAFYEWTAVPHPDGGKPAKQPWCIQRADGDRFVFAGLYEVWRDPDADEGDPTARVVSCTILTRPANQTMAPIHDRMPVMISPSRWSDWLDAGNEDIGALLSSIPPIPDELLTIHAVSTAVNNSRSRGVELMTEVEPMTQHPSLTNT